MWCCHLGSFVHADAPTGSTRVAMLTPLLQRRRPVQKAIQAESRPMRTISIAVVYVQHRFASLRSSPAQPCTPVRLRLQFSVTALDMQTSFTTLPCQVGLRQASPTNNQVVVFWMDLIVQHGHIGGGRDSICT